MADLSDVTNTLAKLADAALYPNGDGQPSVAGVTVTVAPGWPIPAQLDSIIAAGNAMLTVYPMPGMDTNTTRFPAEMQSQADTLPAASLTLTVSGNQVTVGGSIKAGEAATLRVNYQPYSVPVVTSSTTATIAAALAALIPESSAAGSVITITGAFDIEAAVSIPVKMQAEIGRQKRVFMLVAWCPSPAIRDLVIPAIDTAFRSQKRIVMPDNTYARLIYRGTLMMDDAAKQRIYRRDLRYEVEYVTTSTETDNTVTNFGIGIAPTNDTTITINI